MGDGDFNYPIHLALAYLFMAGYLIRTLFVTMKLPGVVGVLLSGFLFGHFIQVEILESRDHLQQLAFFLVLLTAGFEISINDLKPYMIVLALLPCTLELVGITVYASYCFGWSWIEAAVLGTSLFALGDGLVIPKMAEFGFEYPALQVPRLVFTAAPLECSFALTLFGVLKGLAEPADQKEPQAVWIIILANVVRILATLAFGAAVGTASGYFLSHRTELTVPAVKVPVKFTGQPVEAFLLILAVALAAFGLGCEEEGVTMMWPMGFSPGPMLQPELLVIVIGSFFARAADAHVLHGIEGAMSGVWVFGQLILFSMLGSRTELKVFEKFWEVCPLLLVGLSCRLVGVVLANYVTISYRICKNPACKKCKARNEAKFWYDVAFIFVASLPRATIQGALGSIPMTERFFASSPGRKQVQLFIAASAKIYIVLMSVVGSILLDVVGRWSLDKISALPIKCEVLDAEEVAIVDSGGYREQDRDLAELRRQSSVAADSARDSSHRTTRSVAAIEGAAESLGYYELSMVQTLPDEQDESGKLKNEGLERKKSSTASLLAADPEPGAIRALSSPGRNSELHHQGSLQRLGASLAAVVSPEFVQETMDGLAGSMLQIRTAADRTMSPFYGI